MWRDVRYTSLPRRLSGILSISMVEGGREETRNGEEGRRKGGATGQMFSISVSEFLRVNQELSASLRGLASVVRRVVRQPFITARPRPSVGSSSSHESLLERARPVYR